jgi:AraC-like DNA-binding protein
MLARTRSAEPSRDGPHLVVGDHVAMTSASTSGVRLFERRPPVHCVLVGRVRLHVEGGTHSSPGAIAVPANTLHRLSLDGEHACVAYLDPRRFRFEDAARLAERWRSFVPGHDDLREAVGDATGIPPRRVDPRLAVALEALEDPLTTVAGSASRARLSESRLTHLMTETLGAPPRTWRAWLRLQRAIQASVFGGFNLTEAAHRAGFADSAHLTRTCKQLTGVRPAQMMPKTVVVVA